MSSIREKSSKTVTAITFPRFLKRIIFVNDYNYNYQFNFEI